MLTTILETLESTFINEPIKLSEVQKIIIENIEENPSVTKEQLANATGKSRATITLHMKILREKGIISREGSDKSGHWIIRETGR